MADKHYGDILKAFDAGNVTDAKIGFTMEVTGREGAHYTLMCLPGHTAEHITQSRAYIRENFDVTGISIVQVKNPTAGQLRKAAAILDAGASMGKAAEVWA